MFLFEVGLLLDSKTPSVDDGKTHPRTIGPGGDFND